jgi:hypothetical protein
MSPFIENATDEISDSYGLGATTRECEVEVDSLIVWTELISFFDRPR